jgi:hypothetical protein
MHSVQSQCMYSAHNISLLQLLTLLSSQPLLHLFYSRCVLPLTFRAKTDNKFRLESINRVQSAVVWLKFIGQRWDGGGEDSQLCPLPLDGANLLQPIHNVFHINYTIKNMQERWQAPGYYFLNVAHYSISGTRALQYSLH